MWMSRVCDRGSTTDKCGKQAVCPPTSCSTPAPSYYEARALRPLRRPLLHTTTTTTTATTPPSTDSRSVVYFIRCWPTLFVATMDLARRDNSRDTPGPSTGATWRVVFRRYFQPILQLPPRCLFFFFFFVLLSLAQFSGLFYYFLIVFLYGLVLLRCCCYEYREGYKGGLYVGTRGHWCNVGTRGIHGNYEASHHG